MLELIEQNSSCLPTTIYHRQVISIAIGSYEIPDGLGGKQKIL